MKLTLKKWALRIGLNLTDSRQDVVAGPCKRGMSNGSEKENRKYFY